MALTQESWDDANNQDEQKPGRKVSNAGCQRRGRNNLLHHSANCLNHSQPIRGLHSCSLELIVENGVLVGGKVQTGSVLHDPDADVPGEFVSQQSVTIVRRPGENRTERRETEFERHEPPEVGT